LNLAEPFLLAIPLIVATDTDELV